MNREMKYYPLLLQYFLENPFLNMNPLSNTKVEKLTIKKFQVTTMLECIS